MKQSLSVPSEAIDIYNNALNFSNMGKYDVALNEYKRAISIYPQFLEAYNNIGEIYSKMGDFSNAITTYEEALTISRNDRVLLNIGVEYYNQQKYDKALVYFKDSISINPGFLESHFYAAMAFFNKEDYNSAVTHFQKVINFDQRHLKANYLLSYIYYEWKQYRNAATCLERIMDIADDKQFVNRYYGFCMYHLGNYDKAVDYLQVALKENPAYSRFKNYLSSLTYENKIKEVGDVKEKIKEMEAKVMHKDSKPSLKEYSRLSMLYIFNGEYKKAEDLLTSYKLQ
ncbi:MAG: tetratricopeptide repeat protein [Spirochaetes bacterium]|nr:tetratricopeptide repeat protein [Spirochaetota bacterium]